MVLSRGVAIAGHIIFLFIARGIVAANAMMRISFVNVLDPGCVVVMLDREYFKNRIDTRRNGRRSGISPEISMELTLVASLNGPFEDPRELRLVALVINLTVDVSIATGIVSRDEVAAFERDICSLLMRSSVSFIECLPVKAVRNMSGHLVKCYVLWIEECIVKVGFLLLLTLQGSFSVLTGDRPSPTGVKRYQEQTTGQRLTRDLP